MPFPRCFLFKICSHFHSNTFALYLGRVFEYFSSFEWNFCLCKSVIYFIPLSLPLIAQKSQLIKKMKFSGESEVIMLSVLAFDAVFLKINCQCLQNISGTKCM